MEQAIALALQEDIGSGDASANSVVPADLMLEHRLALKQDGVIAGLAVMQRVLAAVDGRIECECLLADGAAAQAGDVAAVLRGPARSVLTAERTALNFMQRMSGVATLTRRFVQAVEGTGAVILDTRKTAPGLRVFDKQAVVLGGGSNHRFGLFDMIMIKDNHIAAAGGITAAVALARKWPNQLPIEVEVATIQQLEEVLTLDVDRVMLDNMDNDTMRQAVKLTAGRVELEASGNVNLETVRAIAETGVQYISVGSLTHSVMALDIHLMTDGFDSSSMTRQQ
ncbi:MAG: carboxylating nicotinate-nucleotide diphosphorylase [Spirochaetaceae bacterium]|nr:MAG: carboxylating nicotinate-nucleotide diphosphorylase [Spirochaetaceae bacterium]